MDTTNRSASCSKYISTSFSKYLHLHLSEVFVEHVAVCLLLHVADFTHAFLARYLWWYLLPILIKMDIGPWLSFQVFFLS